MATNEIKNGCGSSIEAVLASNQKRRCVDWVPLLLALIVPPLLHYGIILREERYLESKFGDEYHRYKTKVPRYWGDSEARGKAYR